MGDYYDIAFTMSPTADHEYTFGDNPTEQDPDDFGLGPISAENATHISLQEDPSTPLVDPQSGTVPIMPPTASQYQLGGLHTAQQEPYITQSIEAPLTVTPETQAPLGGMLAGSHQGSTRRASRISFAENDEPPIPRRRSARNARRASSRSPSSAPPPQCIMEGCTRKPQNGGVVCSKHRTQYAKRNAQHRIVDFDKDMDLEQAVDLIYKVDQPVELDCDEKDDVHEQSSAEWSAHWLERLLAAMNKRYIPAPGTEDIQPYKELLKQQGKFNDKFIDQEEQYNTDMINARLRLLLENVRSFHRGGRWSYAQGGDSSGYGIDDKLTFSKRLETICGILEEFKIIAMDVVEGRGVNAFVGNPGGYKNRKEDNIKSNDNKKRKTANADAHVTAGIATSSMALLHAAATPFPQSVPPMQPSPYTASSAHRASHPMSNTGIPMPPSSRSTRKRSHTAAYLSDHSMPPPRRPRHTRELHTIPESMASPPLYTPHTTAHNHDFWQRQTAPPSCFTPNGFDAHINTLRPSTMYYGPLQHSIDRPSISYPSISQPNTAQPYWPPEEPSTTGNDWPGLLTSMSPSGEHLPTSPEESQWPFSDNPSAHSEVVDPALQLQQAEDAMARYLEEDVYSDAMVDGSAPSGAGGVVNGGTQGDDSTMLVFTDGQDFGYGAASGMGPAS